MPQRQHGEVIERDSEIGIGCRRNYFEALQCDPDVILAHGKMRELLTRLT